MEVAFDLPDAFEFSGFPDTSIFQQQQQIIRADTPPESPNTPSMSTAMLTEEEFESLIKTVQLLRISQLRYIVQKFRIPASGNKTKLLSLVIQIFHNLRYDPVLGEILREINGLLAQQDAPFAAPAIPSGSLELVPCPADYIYNSSPIIAYCEGSSLSGYIMAKPGRSSAKFTFQTPSEQSPSCIAFMFHNGLVSSFFMQIELNGIPFEVSRDDCLPSAIDVSDILAAPGNENVLNIKQMNCNVPIIINVVNYRYIGLSGIISAVTGGDLSGVPLAKSAHCLHTQGFPLIPFLSSALASGKWICPICGAEAPLETLSPVVQDVLMPAESLFGSAGDLFNTTSNDRFDWDSF